MKLTNFYFMCASSTNTRRRKHFSLRFLNNFIAHIILLSFVVIFMLLVNCTRVCTITRTHACALPSKFIKLICWSKTPTNVHQYREYTTITSTTNTTIYWLAMAHNTKYSITLCAISCNR